MFSQCLVVSNILFKYMTTSHSTLHFLGSSAIHPPSVKSMGRTVVEIIDGQTETPSIYKQQQQTDCVKHAFKFTSLGVLRLCSRKGDVTESQVKLKVTHEPSFRPSVLFSLCPMIILSRGIISHMRVITTFLSEEHDNVGELL